MKLHFVKLLLLIIVACKCVCATTTEDGLLHQTASTPRAVALDKSTLNTQILGILDRNKDKIWNEHTQGMHPMYAMLHWMTGRFYGVSFAFQSPPADFGIPTDSPLWIKRPQDSLNGYPLQENYHLDVRQIVRHLLNTAGPWGWKKDALASSQETNVFYHAAAAEFLTDTQTPIHTGTPVELLLSSIRGKAVTMQALHPQKIRHTRDVYWGYYYPYIAFCAHYGYKPLEEDGFNALEDSNIMFRHPNSWNNVDAAIESYQHPLQKGKKLDDARYPLWVENAAFESFHYPRTFHTLQYLDWFTSTFPASKKRIIRECFSCLATLFKDNKNEAEKIANWLKEHYKADAPDLPLHKAIRTDYEPFHSEYQSFLEWCGMHSTSNGQSVQQWLEALLKTDTQHITWITDYMISRIEESNPYQMCAKWLVEKVPTSAERVRTILTRRLKDPNALQQAIAYAGITQP